MKFNMTQLSYAPHITVSEYEMKYHISNKPISITLSK